MFRLFVAAVVGVVMSVTARAEDLRITLPNAKAPVQIMVLGAWHFSNPGLDAVNLNSDDVTKPKRQKELQQLVDALAAFRPTKVMVERVVEAPGFVDSRFASYGPETLAADRGEDVQIGHRLARQLGHAHVYGIDEQPDATEPDYFPIDALTAWTEAQGRRAELDAIIAPARARAAQIDAMQKRQSIAEILAAINAPGVAESEQGVYYAMLRLANDGAQPGADLNAAYYLRNAKIFAKITTIVQPGDRVLVIFGAGHAFWLRHFASLTPGFQSVDPSPCLRRAQRMP